MAPVQGIDERRRIIKLLQKERFEDANAAADYVFDRLGEPALRALRPQAQIPTPLDGHEAVQRYRSRVIRVLREAGVAAAARHQRLADSPPAVWEGKRAGTGVLVKRLKELLNERARLYESAQLYVHFYTTAGSLPRLVIWRRIVCITGAPRQSRRST